MRILALVVVVACSSAKDVEERPATESAPVPEATETKASEPTATEEEPSAEAPVADDATVERLLGELAAAAHCEAPASSQKHWCIAAQGWASATAAPLPSNPIVLAGMTVELVDGKSVSDALAKSVNLNAMALRSVEGKSRIRIIGVLTPLAPDVLTKLRAIFAGDAPSVVIPKKLHTFYDPNKAEVRYEVHKKGSGWSWFGNSFGELRSAGDYWVSIEIPTWGPPRIHLSVYSDKVFLDPMAE